MINFKKVKMSRIKKSWLGRLFSFIFCKDKKESDNSVLSNNSIPGGGIKNPNG